MRRFAKPVSGVTCSEGSNPSLSAIFRAPVAQWIEHLVADQKVVSSSLAGRATRACVNEALSYVQRALVFASYPPSVPPLGPEFRTRSSVDQSI